MITLRNPYLVSRHLHSAAKRISSGWIVPRTANFCPSRTFSSARPRETSTYASTWAQPWKPARTQIEAHNEWKAKWMCTPTLRVVCIANIPPSTSVDELLNLVHFGPIESIRLLPEKDSIFLAFLDASTAADFFADALRHRLTLDWHRLTLGWGHPSSVPPHVNQAVTERGATRHVYLEDLEARLTKDTLRHELTTFGPVEQIKLGRDRDVRVASVHFLTINDAMKAMKTLHGMCERVEYRQDRCGSWPSNPKPTGHRLHSAAAQSHRPPPPPPIDADKTDALFANPFAYHDSSSLSSPVSTNPAATPLSRADPDSSPFTSAHPLASANPYANPTSAHADDANSILGQQTGEELENGQKRRLLEQAAKTGMSLAMPNGNRTLCISNITPTTTREYLCNVVRGGMLQNVRLYTEGFPLAYITFVDPIAAFTFFQTVSYDRPLTIHDRRLSVSWGKHSGALPAPLAHAIQAGATRTVHIGNIQDFDLFNAKRLEDDWEVFGRLESVHLAKGENCAFVNFSNISAALKAVDVVRTWRAYAELRIAFGMDRCANPLPGEVPCVLPGANESGTHSMKPMSAIEPARRMGWDEQVQVDDLDAYSASAQRLPTSPGRTLPIVQLENVRDFERFSAERLKADWTVFGALESVYVVEHEHRAVLRFRHIVNAVNAVEVVRKWPRYVGLRITQLVDEGAIEAPASASEDWADSGKPAPKIVWDEGRPMGQDRNRADGKQIWAEGAEGRPVQREEMAAQREGMMASGESDSAFAQVPMAHPTSARVPTWLARAIDAGATRTVQIGDVQDFELFSVERLTADWEVFGAIESVQLAEAQNCAFVNFANIANAVRAVEMVQNWPEYASLRFAFGMDRCADPINSAESISGIDGAGPGEDSDGVQVQAKGAYADAEAVEVKLE